MTAHFNHYTRKLHKLKFQQGPKKIRGPGASLRIPW